jgi:dephospho-CoA kinase
VARILSKRGIPTFDADAAVHELYEPGRPGAALVGELFGHEMLDDEGGVVRAALADRVLGDNDVRLRLEGAIHPLVREAVQDWLLTVADRSVAVVEAALLVETGTYRLYDVLVVVSCAHQQQLDRALARGVPAERAHRLISAQFPMADKRALADAVVDNSGTLGDLEREVDRAWSTVHRLCAARSAKPRFS